MTVTELNVGGSNMTVELRGNILCAESNTGNKQWVAVLVGTHPQYNYEREFVAYQKPKTTNRDSGTVPVNEGAVIERVRYTHSGKNRKDSYYQLVDGEAHPIDEVDVVAAIEGEIVPDVEDETHECEECGDEFDSEHGLAVHEGMVHSEDEDDATEADGGETRTVVADGGVDVSDYDIDPTELDYDESTRSSTKDSTNNRTNVLGRLADSDIWVAYRSWQTGPNEYDYAIKGIGRLSVRGVDLDTEAVAETIRDETSEYIRDGPDEWDETTELLSELAERADEVAAELDEAWQYASEEVVGDAIYEGLANVDGTTAWSSHVEEAFGYEVRDALEAAGIEQDEHGCVVDFTRQGLAAGVRKRRDHYLRPHLEYEVKMEFEIEPWELRALELQQQSVLANKPELAKVKALREEGHRQAEIAEMLEKSPSTVSRQVSQLEEWEARAEWTVRNNN